MNQENRAYWTIGGIAAAFLSASLASNIHTEDVNIAVTKKHSVRREGHHGLPAYDRYVTNSQGEVFSNEADPLHGKFTSDIRSLDRQIEQGKSYLATVSGWPCLSKLGLPRNIVKIQEIGEAQVSTPSL